MIEGLQADPPIEAIRELLTAMRLPSDDVDPARGQQYFGIRRDGAWQAVVGLERLGTAGLLRSLAVTPAMRGQGLGQVLVAQVESSARGSGVTELYLLTTDAAAYFRRMGFREVARGNVPAAVQRHAQFRTLCPATAQVLRKDLT